MVYVWTSFTAATIIVALIATFVALAQSPVSPLFNFASTLSWTPGKVIECNTIQDVVVAVSEAKAAYEDDGISNSTSNTSPPEGARVKVYGTGWSWSTSIAGDGDTYLRLTGDLANVSNVEFNTMDHNATNNNDTDGVGPTVTVGGGVRAFDLYMALQDTAYNIEAKGACLSSVESQTIGGLLATNVHHSGIKTFYDVAVWVDIVTSKDGLVRTYRNETLFQLTIGGGGRTGVIVRAQLHLAPRATYESVDLSNAQLASNSFEDVFTGFVDLTRGYEPNEFIATCLVPPGVASVVQPASYAALRKMPVASSNPAILPTNYGEPSGCYCVFTFLDDIFDSLLPPCLYELFALVAVATIMPGVQPNLQGTNGVDLDVACSGSDIANFKRQETELFVPVDLAGEVGRFFDNRFATDDFPYLKNSALIFLRNVFGVESLTASNGLLSDGSSPDCIAVNIDGVQRSQFDRYNAEVNALVAELSTEFPLQIRLHPGKYNPPLLPDPESQDVKDLIAEYDPTGLFARDRYDEIYLTRR